MTTDGEKWHYLAGKKGASLCREITVKPVGDFYCLNCFHSYSTKKNLEGIIMYVKFILITM